MTFECPSPIEDFSHVWCVENAAPLGANPQADGRSEQRMLDWKCLESEMVDQEGVPRGNRPFRLDGKSAERGPRLARGIHRTWRSCRQSTGMIGMRMGEDDGCRGEGIVLVQPVAAAIYHDPGTLALNEKRAMPKVSWRPQDYTAARSEKRELEPGHLLSIRNARCAPKTSRVEWHIRYLRLELHPKKPDVRPDVHGARKLRPKPGL